jgi:HK97 family phage major capsid protein
MLLSRKGDDFQAVIKALVNARGNLELAARIAQDENYPARAVEFTKAAVAAGSTTDAAWAGPLVGFRDLVGDWFETLRNFSVVDALIAQGAKRISANVRFLLMTLAAKGGNLAEAAWWPLSKMELGSSRQGYVTSLSAIVVSDEILRFSAESTQNLINTELAGSVAGASNATAVTMLLDSITPTVSTGDARLDLRTLFASIDLGSRSRPLLIAAPGVVKQMAFLGGSNDGAPTFPDITIPTGGMISGVPLIAVDELHAHGAAGADGDMLMVVDAAQIAADPGVFTLDISKQATLQMSDAPNQAPSNMVSMYQTNSIAIRSRRIFSLQRVRASAVAAVKLVNYGQVGSP